MFNDTHGADIYSAAEKSGINKDEFIDFSSNINPLGIPERVKKSAIDSIEDAIKYPDINARELTKNISDAENVPEGWIFASNGAADAIYRISFYLKPKRGIVTSPAFSEYENSLTAAGSLVEYYNLKEEHEYKIQNDFIDYINSETDIVFLCNPNNPTGQITNKDIIEKIVARCKKSDTLVVIDECFLDFVENKEKYSAVNLLEKYDNLIILKAFTKIFAIPGIRLGYCMSSNKNVIDGLKVIGPPWNVSTIAQAAGVAALKEKAYINETVSYIKLQREYLVQELNKLNIKTYKSYANYMLFKNYDEMDLKEELVKKRILIRSCSNYRGLDRSFYRIAVKSAEENKLLIEAMTELKGKQWRQFWWY